MLSPKAIKKLQEKDITMLNQLASLVILREASRYMHELADALKIDRNGIKRFLDRMIDTGIVEKKERREQRGGAGGRPGHEKYYLTSKGRKLLEPVARKLKPIQVMQQEGIRTLKQMSLLATLNESPCYMQELADKTDSHLQMTKRYLADMEENGFVTIKRQKQVNVLRGGRPSELLFMPTNKSLVLLNGMSKDIARQIEVSRPSATNRIA